MDPNSTIEPSGSGSQLDAAISPVSAAASVHPFILIEPQHERPKQSDTKISFQDDVSPRTSLSETEASNNVSDQERDQDRIDTVPDDHLSPRPDLQKRLTSYSIRRRDTRVTLGTSDILATDELAFDQSQQQSIYLMDEDIQLHLRFYRQRSGMLILWFILCVVTAGVWYIVDAWAKNKFWIRWNTVRTSLITTKDQQPSDHKDKLIRIESKHGEVENLRLKRIHFPSPVSKAQVFPPSLVPPFESAEQAALQRGSTPVKLDASSQEQGTLLHVDVLEYRASSFLLHPDTGKFRQLTSWRDPDWAVAFDSPSDLTYVGLPSKVVVDREALFGPNQVSVKGRSAFNIMVEEALHPFYIFQIYSIILWSNDDYVPFAVAIACVSLVGIGATTITTKQAIEKLKKMSRFSCDVAALREEEQPPAQTTPSLESASLEKDILAKPASPVSSWTRFNSEKLVPGDIIDLAATYPSEGISSHKQQGRRLLETLPCDVILLEGDCILNESMLTGESVPVVKSPVYRSDLASVLAPGGDLHKLDRNILYSGTKLVRVRPGADGITTKALVIRTGFSTAKGSLVRKMLFPRPSNFKFYRDAFIFVGYLFVIATIGMIATIIYFETIGVSSTEIALRSLDVLTIAVPPALPATLAICVTFSLARLRKAKMFCLSPQRINVAGMVNMFVFDKTGTLTEEGLDVSGIRRVEHGNFTSLEQQPVQPSEKRSDLDLLEALATAHDLNLLEGKPIGEPLEVKMLEWSGRTLQDDQNIAPVYLSNVNEAAPEAQTARRPLSKDGHLARVPVITATPGLPALAVIRMFDFSASLRRMSVIVKREGQLSAQVYCKGAPESISSLCVPSSLPQDYAQVLDRCTKAGFRVLAVAGRTIDQLGWQSAQAMTRTQAEVDLEFLGLIIFENKLKALTIPTIDTIREDARLPIKMCTGDSVLTAISVAKECGIMASTSEVYAARVAKSDKVAIEWVSIDREDDRLDPYSLDPIGKAGKKLKDVELAVSGELLSELLEACSAETLARILVHGKVFGRFSPEQKQELVEHLQDLGYVVAFTGDGANDCGALKSADVGLSLSEADASAAAAFTSRVKDISAITHLIREGRSTLTVSFAMFKWMSVYSLTEYFTVILLYGQATSLDNAEYFFIDLFCVVSVSLGLAHTKPAKKLWKVSPDSRISSSRPVISMLAQVILGFLAQTVAYVVLHRESWYEPPHFDADDLELNNMDNTVLFRVSIFTYLIAAYAFSLGPPHRQLLVYNWIMFPAMFALTVFAFYFLFVSGGPFFDLFGFVQIPHYYFFVMFGIVIAQTVLSMVFEFVALSYVARMIAKPFNALARKFRKRTEKPYKAVVKSISAA